MASDVEAIPRRSFSNGFNGGVGLRPIHYPDFLSAPPAAISWLEIISENFMDSAGRPRHVLETLRRDFPIATHGVSLNIGSPEQINTDYLARLKKHIERIDPFIVSDHLCWTGFSAHNAHDLLPLVHNENSLEIIGDKVSRVQDFLGRPIALENVSSYIESRHSTYSEAQFLARLAKKTGCGLLLDINNIYVSETNFARDPKKFIDTLPMGSVLQIHLAGFTDTGKFLFDTHSNPVFPAVWQLYEYALPKLRSIPVLIEWDEDIPSIEKLSEEVSKAQFLHNRHFGIAQEKAPSL